MPMSHVAKAGEKENKTAHKNLRRIPGVGPRIAEDMTSIGIRSVVDLKGKDPEQLYHKLCRHVGKPVDRCMLYVFRCAVYFASNSNHEPELLKWWNWKDKKHPHGVVKHAK